MSSQQHAPPTASRRAGREGVSSQSGERHIGTKGGGLRMTMEEEKKKMEGEGTQYVTITNLSNQILSSLDMCLYIMF